MLRAMEMGAGMTVLRRITAANVAAFQAHAQMNPAIACFEAVFAAFAAGFHTLYVVLDVGTSCHWFLLLFKTPHCAPNLIYASSLVLVV
jgi:hypothetical protein